MLLCEERPQSSFRAAHTRCAFGAFCVNSEAYSRLCEIHLLIPIDWKNCYHSTGHLQRAQLKTEMQNINNYSEHYCKNKIVNS